MAPPLNPPSTEHGSGSQPMGQQGTGQLPDTSETPPEPHPFRNHSSIPVILRARKRELSRTPIRTPALNLEIPALPSLPRPNPAYFNRNFKGILGAHRLLSVPGIQFLYFFIDPTLRILPRTLNHYSPYHLYKGLEEEIPLLAEVVPPYPHIYWYLPVSVNTVNANSIRSSRTRGWPRLRIYIPSSYLNFLSLPYPSLPDLPDSSDLPGHVLPTPLSSVNPRSRTRDRDEEAWRANLLIGAVQLPPIPDSE